MIKQSKAGQIIVEVLFAIGVVAMCLIALTAVSSTAINNGIYAKNAQLANRYAQEGLEIARRERDRADGWQDFYNSFNNDWCLSSAYLWTNCNCFNPSPNVGIFFRCLTFVNDTAERKSITAQVSWTDGNKTHEVEATTFLTKWSK